MKLLTFIVQGKQRLGVKTDQGILDVESALAAIPSTGILTNVMDIIHGGQDALAKLNAYVDKVLGTNHAGLLLEESKLKLAPSVTHPGKIICVGLNYRKHAEETGSPIPKFPILFNKFNNTLTAFGDDVALPKVSVKVDYEVELVIVIGKTAKYVDKEQALDYVFGYSTVNDISARDLQLRTPQWMLGKCCDGFTPLGPYVVTSDEVPEPNDLKLKCTVNGEIRQNSNTSDMIFKCDEIVSYISQHMTLSPGDIILTGTPEGVVMGYPEGKQVYLKHGDMVTVEVEGLGAMTNRMVAEEM